MTKVSFFLKTFFLTAVAIVAALILLSEVVNHFDTWVFCGHMAMCDGQATAEAWIDSNGNGRRDAGELPLAGACIWFQYTGTLSAFDEQTDPCQQPASFTNNEGGVGRFLPGATCSEVYFFARVPVGYQPTTPIAVHACTAKFGFAPAGSVPVLTVLSPSEFARRENAANELEQLVTRLACITILALPAILFVPRLVRLKR